MSPKRVRVSDQVLNALSTVRTDVEQCGNAFDQRYFTLHEERFARSAQRLLDLLPAARSGALLDIGSHYLHLSSLLTLLDYKVTGVDVAEFTQLPFVQERAQKFGLANSELRPGALAAGDILGEARGRFDGVIFCEILEHITFNPIRFWRRIYDLLRVNGIIYITTPNGLQLLAVLGAIWNAASLKRRGIRVDHIFSNVTYGHHWKEYGAGEIREYFARLSPDFDVAVHGFSFRDSPGRDTDAGPMKAALRRLGNATGPLAENLEAVVRLRSRTAWRAVPPTFG